MTDHLIHTLPNGIRIVHKTAPYTKVVHCGIILDIGSRDEKPDQEGIVHFWEHMAFKGTKRRKAYHILNRIDSVGGELNAYTTKEKLCFYVSVLSQHVDKAMELLSDIAFHSIFPEKELEKERDVIMEEMAMYLDTPEDAIQDDFESLVFGSHPLGHNILGTAENLGQFKRTDFIKFIAENLDTSRIAFSFVGPVEFNKVIKKCEKHLGHIALSRNRIYREKFDEYLPATKLVKKNIMQAQCAIGGTAYSVNSEKRAGLHLLVNLLGGPTMNSRLSLGIREKYGFVYSIDAGYSSYSDTGMFSVMFGTDSGKLYRCVDLVLKEFKKLTSKALTPIQLHRTKEQFLGQMAMSEENNTSLMLMMGRSLLDLGKVETFDNAVSTIKSLEANDLLDIANEILDPSRLSFLYFKPKGENELSD